MDILCNYNYIEYSLLFNKSACLFSGFSGFIGFSVFSGFIRVI